MKPNASASAQRAPLAIAKARGVVLGKAGATNLRPNIEERKRNADAFAEKLRPLFDGMKLRGLSQRAMVKELNSVGLSGSKGGIWHLSQVQRVIQTLGAHQNRNFV